MKVPQNYSFLFMYFFLSTEVQNADVLHHYLAAGKLNQKKGISLNAGILHYSLAIDKLNQKKRELL